MLFLLICTSIVLGLLLAYTLWTRNFDYWDKKGVPSEKPSFPYGNVKPIFDKKENFSDLLSQYKIKWPNAPLIGFYSFFKPMLIVCDPEIIKTILVTDFHKFTDINFALSKNEKLLSRGSFWAKGHKSWKEKRSRFTSSFTPAKMKGMVPIMTDSFNRHIEACFSTKIKELEIPSFVLKDSILRVVFSIEMDLLKEKQNEKSSLKMLLNDSTFSSPNQHLTQFASQFAHWLFMFYELLIMTEEAQDFFVKFVKTCVQERKISKNPRNDILQTLINQEKKALDDGREGFDDFEWAANILTVYLDSTETIGLMFNFVLYRLGAHLDEQEKLRSEILKVGSSLADFDYDKLHSIKRLEMFLNETLRIHPLLSVLPKTCIETTKLGDVVVEKGTPVFIPVTYFHWDSKYHPDPMTFNPERFTDMRSMPSCAFFPFGDGPRVCLGQKYAQTVLRVLIVGYLLNYRVSFEDGFELKYTKQSPLLMVFEKNPEYKFELLKK